MEVKYTKRYRLGQLLSTLTRHFLLLTATPHNGKEEDFQLFMALLDGDRFEGRFRDGVHTADVSDLMRRMVKETLLKFDATPLFPERIATTVPYKLSDAEARCESAWGPDADRQDIDYYPIPGVKLRRLVTVGPPSFHRRARAHPAIRHSDRRFSGHSCRDTTSPMPPSTSVTILDRQGLTEASCECYQLVRYARRFSPSQNIRVILSAHP